MLLVDTSVWIDYLRSGDPLLAELLDQSVVASHDFVIGEIACSNLKNRQEVLSLLALLPQCAQVTHEEVLSFIERHQLIGRGIGYVDACLLAAATLSRMQLLDTGQAAGRHRRSDRMRVRAKNDATP